MKIRFAIFVFCLWVIPAAATADCFYKGHQYPEGTRIGVLVCENSRWVPRP